jgi:hypothetical protein
MIHIETIPGMGQEEQRRMLEDLNSSMIHLICCKNFCKCHLAQQNKRQMNKKKKECRETEPIIYCW